MQKSLQTCPPILQVIYTIFVMYSNYIWISIVIRIIYYSYYGHFVIASLLYFVLYKQTMHLTSCVRAEHSRYFTAPISSIISKPCGYVIGANPFSFSFSVVSLSSLKSSLVPTNITGVFAWTVMADLWMPLCPHNKGKNMI